MPQKWDYVVSVLYIWRRVFCTGLDNLLYLRGMNIPDLFKNTLTEDDLDILGSLCDDDIDYFSQLTLGEWEYFQAKSRHLHLPAALLWYTWPKTEEERNEAKCLADAISPLTKLYGQRSTPEETFDACIVADAIGRLCVIWHDDIPRLVKIVGNRSPLESTMIASGGLECCCSLSDEEGYSFRVLRATAEVFFAVLPRAIHAMLRTLYAGVLMHPNLLALYAVYVLSETARTHTGVKNWWRAIYRVYHDRGFAIASCEAAFVSYMTSVFSPMLLMKQAFPLPARVDECVWKYTDKTGKPDVDKSPLKRGDTGNYPHYNDTPWSEWKDEYGRLFLASVEDDQSAVELKNKYGEVSLFKGMQAVAMRLDELLTYTLGPSPYI